MEAIAHPDPNFHGRRIGSLAQQLRHPREQNLRRLSPPDTLGKIGQDLIGAGAPTVDGDVCQSLETGSHRLQQDGGKRNGEDGEEWVEPWTLAEEAPDPANHNAIGGRHEYGKASIEDGPADDDVDG